MLDVHMKQLCTQWVGRVAGLLLWALVLDASPYDGLSHASQCIALM